MIYPKPTMHKTWGSLHRNEDPELTERKRQFECVAKVALQTDVFWHGGLSLRKDVRMKKRARVYSIAEDHFGLTPPQAKVCVARAREFLDFVSNSVSSETLIIQARKRLKKAQ